MELGVITTPWAVARGLGLPETLGRVAAMGFQHVDIAEFMYHDTLVSSEAERQEAAHAVHDLGLKVSCVVLWPPNVASPDQGEQDRCFEHVRFGIDFAARLGAHRTLLNAGRRVIGLAHQQAWQNSVSFLRRCADYALDKDVRVLVESEPYVYFLVNDLATSIEMVREVGRPNCLAIVDLGHMWLSRESPAAVADAASIIDHVHITDNDGLLHTNGIIGSGTVLVSEYLAAIHASAAEANCAARNDTLVAVMELGVPGDSIDSPERWVRESMAHVQAAAPFLSLH